MPNLRRVRTDAGLCRRYSVRAIGQNQPKAGQGFLAFRPIALRIDRSCPPLPPMQFSHVDAVPYPVTFPSATTIWRRQVAAIFSSWVEIRKLVPSSRLIWAINSIT